MYCVSLCVSTVLLVGTSCFWFSTGATCLELRMRTLSVLRCVAKGCNLVCKHKPLPTFYAVAMPADLLSAVSPPDLLATTRLYNVAVSDR